MVVLISVSLLVVIFLVIVSPTVEAADFGDIHSKLNGEQEIVHCSNRVGGLLDIPPDHQTCGLLLDDDNAEHQDWSPWSFPPVCIPPEDDPEGGWGKLCTYTVFSLRGGPGMSVVSTPEVASSIAKSMQDPDITWLERERGIPFAPSFPPSKLPYEMKAIPGKGTGVVATAPIAKGQVLMIETPILLELEDLEPWNIRGIFELLQNAAVRLPKIDRGRMLNLTRLGKAYIVQDIMKSNSFQVTVGGVSHSGLFPDIARINHACRPNCFTRFSPTALSMEVVAYTDIQPGEELSLSYLPLNLHYRERQATLLQNWGFKCTCSLCNHPHPEREGSAQEARRISDRRRQRIGDILQELSSTKAAKLTSKKVQKRVKEIEELVSKEGLHSQIGDLYGMVADTCVEKVTTGEGERDKEEQLELVLLAKELAKKSVKRKKWFAGVDSARTAIALEKLERLENLERVLKTGGAM
ncbi:N-lysine methyltransferase SMYD2 [Naviculisporaceae sp. PSN 640]